MPDWLSLPCAVPDAAAAERAAARQAQLTKPPGSLGRLEALAVQLAALRGTDHPSVERVQVCVFAGDHGVAAQGVSAFPQAVTAQMLANFVAGGAARCRSSTSGRRPIPGRCPASSTPASRR